MALTREDERAARLAELERHLRDAIDAPPAEHSPGFRAAGPRRSPSGRHDGRTAILLALMTVGIVGAVPLLDAIRTMTTPRPTGNVAGAATAPGSDPATPSAAAATGPGGPSASGVPASNGTGTVATATPGSPAFTPGGGGSPAPGPGTTPSPTAEISGETSPPRPSPSPATGTGTSATPPVRATRPRHRSRAEAHGRVTRQHRGPRCLP